MNIGDFRWRCLRDAWGRPYETPVVIEVDGKQHQLQDLRVENGSIVLSSKPRKEVKQSDTDADKRRHRRTPASE